MRAARARLSLTRADVAAETGVGTASIERIENEEVQPREQTMAKLRAFYEEKGIRFLADGIKWAKVKD